LACLPSDVLASASADGTLRLWDLAHGGEPTWLWSGHGALVDVVSMLEDTLFVVGLAVSPTVLSLDYVEAAACVPSVLERLQLPMLKPWKRSHGEAAAPPEGIGRHSALQRRQRLRHGSARGHSGVVQMEPAHVEPRGAFDRSLKSKAIPLGATGAAHRAFLCGLRR